MIERKKKLLFIQFSLLLIGLLVIYLTYYNKELNQQVNAPIIDENKINVKSKNDMGEEVDLFFNVEYTGLDLNGNRYLLKSNEAYLDKTDPALVYMSVLEATFFFKDDTILYVWSDKGIYNNKTLDMNFEKNVKAKYLSSELFAEKAEYSNSKNYLSIYDNVKINDIKGNLIADKLVFDITNQKLDITSFNSGKINANVNLNEKRF
jgi:hypothetical protein